MSNIAIAAVGSRGDVAPMTGLGVAFRRAGHRVVVAAYAPFRDLVTRCGLEFRELPGSPGDVDGADVKPLKALAEFLAPSGIRAMGQSVLDALRDEPADAYLLSPFSEFAGHPLAEARGVPSIGVRLQPLSATAANPPAIMGGWSAGTLGNRLASDTGAWFLDRLYGGVVGGFRRQLGLNAASPRSLRRARTRAKWPVLYGYSPTIAPRPGDWRPGLDVVGYWWPEHAADWRPSDVLADFLASGPPPVFIGLGSTMNSAAQAERMSAVVVEALRRARMRGVVQAGWAGLDVAGDDVITVGDVPYDWLFPRMAAVAHHCGAGTTASGLRAGVPMIAMPGLGDQPFWARRLHHLGASAATIPQRRLNADRLARAIRIAMRDKSIRETSEDLSSRIAEEDGAGRALATVESVLSVSS